MTCTKAISRNEMAVVLLKTLQTLIRNQDTSEAALHVENRGPSKTGLDSSFCVCVCGQHLNCARCEGPLQQSQSCSGSWKSLLLKAFSSAWIGCLTSIVETHEESEALELAEQQSLEVVIS